MRENALNPGSGSAAHGDAISVFGLGKLGSPIAACLAARGFRVTAVDVDPERVGALQSRVPPVYEPGLRELIVAAGDRLRATSDVQEAILNSDASFVVVGTPSESDGGFSLRYVLSAMEDIGAALRTKNSFHLVVLTSTVMPGATDATVKGTLERASGKRCGQDFGLCYSPEFVALGTVIHDFYHPDFVLVGESDSRSGDILESIYRRTCRNSPAIARMSIVNAEVTKLAVNSFVTIKISFANMIARLCEQLPGADVNVVTGALGHDTRIGPKYLKGAVSYGGPCFPRDNRAMAVLATRSGTTADLAEAADRFNRAQVHWLAGVVKRHYAGIGAVGILGLTYKPNTDVVEEAFGFLLSQELARAHLPVVVFDPVADARAALAAYPTISHASSARACIDAADLVVVATPWTAFTELRGNEWVGGRERTVFDCWGAVRHLESTHGIRYIRLGHGQIATAPVPQAE